MSNARKIRTRQFTPRAATAVKLLDVVTAAPGERCQFHPDCCDMDDMTCAGCGEPASRTAIFRHGGREQRVPYCQEHAGFVGDAMSALAQRQAGEAN